MYRLTEWLRALMMAVIAIPLSVIAFIVVAWWLIAKPDGAYPYVDGGDDESDLTP